MFEIIKDLDQKTLTDFFINDPRLSYLALSDEELGYMGIHKEYPISQYSTYLGIKKNNILIAILKWEWYSNIAINFHMYFKSDIHHTKYVRELSEFIHKFAKENIVAKKVLLMVPAPCKHIHKFVPKYGFKKEAKLKGISMWRQKRVDTIIYGMEL